MPVVFAFAIAPAVFLFLHVYSLIRFDMLAANLRQFWTELRISALSAEDRERCQQLLANVEFVQGRTAAVGSKLYSQLYRLVTWLVLAGLPIFTLIVIQISSLRYQSIKVLRTQEVCIALDLVLLGWFFYRERRRKERSANISRFHWARYSAPFLLAAVVLALNLIYIRIPGADEKSVRATDYRKVGWGDVYRQPLDLVLCPTLRWGCRYLTVDHRTIVGHVWRPKAIIELRSDQPETQKSNEETEKSLFAIEGIFLRGRTLRFVKFDESDLYAADLTEADLRGATFIESRMQGADLDGAHLQKASLRLANLRAASLEGSVLDGSDLTAANLQGASLVDASLEGADLTGAALQGKLGSALAKRAP